MSEICDGIQERVKIIGYGRLDREDKIHTILPEELPNSKQTNNQYLDERRADRASETTPHPRTDIRFKNDLEQAHPIRQG
jgi:hypothetical protein